MRCHSVSCDTASQTQLGFESAPIAGRLRGQGYGDFPWRGVHFFSTAHLNNRLSDTIECSQPLPKNFNPKFSTLSIQNIIQRLNGYAGCSRSHRALIRVYDDAGNVIETHEHAGEFKRVVSFYLRRLRQVCIDRTSLFAAVAYLRLLRSMCSCHVASTLLLTLSFSMHAHSAVVPLAIPIQITHAQNFDPSPSPDGKRLVYISMVSGKEQLFTMNVDGSASVQLTRDDADHEDPAWSPDGTRIAFVRISDGHNRIAMMPSEGGSGEVLTPPEQNTIHPNWASDSKRIIYCTNDDLQPPKKNTAEIYSIDLVTKKVTPIITGGINTYGSWSPDMRQIAFRKIIGDENSEVFLANSNGSNLRNLTNNPFFDGWPAWSPDGKQIAFTVS